jgi:hypothetical protein
MFTLSSAYAGAGPIAAPGNPAAGVLFNENHAGPNHLEQQSESPGPMMAQTEAYADEHYCVGHCRRHFEERMKECSAPDHPHHHRCEEWARERERECLDGCYKEHPRY